MSQTKKKGQPKKRTSRERQKRREQKIMRRRIVFVMIFIVILLVAAVLIGIASSSFGSKAEVTTLTVENKEKILLEEVEPLDEDYYKKSDISSYIKDLVKEYNDNNEGTVKIEKIKANKTNAYVKTSYENPGVYQGFTGHELFAGTIAKAQAAGYDFEDAFVSVEKGKKKISVPTEEVLKDTDCKVVIVRQNIHVAVKGKICYISDGCTTLKSENEVEIAQHDGNNDATVLTYIIYK